MKAISLLFIISILLCRDVSGEAFNRSSLHLSYNLNTNRELYHQYWKPANGIEMTFRTDYYLGRLEVGYCYTKHHNLYPAQPPFASHYPFVGWINRLEIYKRLNLYAGPRIGSFFMTFDDDHTNAEEITELELALEMVAGVEIDIYDNFAAALALKQRIIFTREKIRLTFISIGLVYEFETPGWLKGFLR